MSRSEQPNAGQSHAGRVLSPALEHYGFRCETHTSVKKPIGGSEDIQFGEAR